MHGCGRVWPSGYVAGYGLARWNRAYKKQTKAIFKIDSAIKNGEDTAPGAQTPDVRPVLPKTCGRHIRSGR